MRPRAKSKPTEFNPNSIDAQFATLHAELRAQNQDRKDRMDSQDEVLKEIKIQTTLTNGRVTSLETKWARTAGWMTGAAATATLIVHTLFYLFRR